MIRDGITFLAHYGDRYPVPYVMSWNYGIPDFTRMDDDRVRECNRRNLCSVCGRSMNVKKDIAYIGLPYSKEDIEGGGLWFADPPMHVGCAAFSMEHCPHFNPAITQDGPENTTPDQDGYLIYICRGRIINKNGFSTRPQRLMHVLKRDNDGRDKDSAESVETPKL